MPRYGCGPPWPPAAGSWTTRARRAPGSSRIGPATRSASPPGPMAHRSPTTTRPPEEASNDLGTSRGGRQAGPEVSAVWRYRVRPPAGPDGLAVGYDEP